MAAAPAPTIESLFEAFSKFGDPKSDGKVITLTQSDKWMKQAKVIDGKHITTTDTGIAFNKHKMKSMDLKTFMKYVEDLAQSKKMAPEDLIAKLTQCGPPGTSHTTKAVTAGAVDRLTDTSKYTGSHKERFDESGKGKGIEGRADVADSSGYVQGYKHKDTYDKRKSKGE